VTIRFGNKFDVELICTLLLEFVDENKHQFTTLNLKDAQSKEYVVQRITEVLAGQGFILICPDGLIVAIKAPSFWLKDVYSLQEVIWYGRNRKTTLKLLKAYLEVGEKMKQSGEVQDVYFGSYKDVNFETLKAKRLSYHWMI